jgi:hypothetical protein
MTINCGTSTVLFNGAVPPNGFMVGITGSAYVINDNGLAAYLPTQSGFLVQANSVFVTPPGYKPMGAVSVFCLSGATAYVAARAW